jgi:hypothetical protein
MTDPAGPSPAEIERLVAGLARFGAPGPGVTRLAFDPAWCEAHAWLAAEARSRGLAATPDAAGNLFLHDPALPPGRRPVFLTGSHLPGCCSPRRSAAPAIRRWWGW